LFLEQKELQLVFLDEQAVLQKSKKRSMPSKNSKSTKKAAVFTRDVVVCITCKTKPQFYRQFQECVDCAADKIWNPKNPKKD
jgi:hypothetical protein